MSRMVPVALVLIGLAACGKDTKQQVAKSDSKTRSTAAATRSAGPATTKAHASKSNAKAKSQRKVAARADTATPRPNPLTGH